MQNNSLYRECVTGLERLNVFPCAIANIWSFHLGGMEKFFSGSELMDGFQLRICRCNLLSIERGKWEQGPTEINAAQREKPLWILQADSHVISVDKTGAERGGLPLMRLLRFLESRHLQHPNQTSQSRSWDASRNVCVNSLCPESARKNQIYVDAFTCQIRRLQHNSLDF